MESVAVTSTDAATTLATPSIQVIDENKIFNKDLGAYLSKYYQTKDDSGLNYHVVSVFGSQSTGKSTLLNHLFGTQFNVMNESQRQQTTKGIWLAHAETISNTQHLSSTANGDIFVMDVEGTDGRERGEDQDFERKSALFLLATSETLIVNIWEHQVGLYQGANMGLLKTVFEVNLSLFSQNKQKSCVLFVIRDHIGVTPLENLAATLKEDLHKIWSQLSKPAGLEDVQLEQFFDLKFWALPHKLLQLDKFLEDVSKLGDEFLTPNQIFDKSYHRNVPVDGWSVYAEQIWEQIELNKDLDLPTQHILVARFRCDEIANEQYKLFEDEFHGLKSSDQDDLSALGANIKQLRTTSISNYDSNASRYAPSLYQLRRKLLVQKIDSEIKELHSSILSSLSKKTLDHFGSELVSNKKVKGVKFGQLLLISLASALKFFQESSNFLQIEDSDDVDLLGIFSNEKQLVELTNNLKDLSDKEKEKELESVVNKIVKKFNVSFKEIVFDNLSDPHTESWDKILAGFNDLVDSLTSKYKKSGEDATTSYDFDLDLSPETNEATYNRIRSKCWKQFHEIVHDFVTEDNVINILKNKFDDFFRYDEKGLPKLWESTVEIDKYFTSARTKTLDLIPILAIAKTSENVEILPDIDIEPEEDEDEDDEDESGASKLSSPHQFAHLLSFKQETAIVAKFKKQIDLIYTDAKRSIVQSRTAIPAYFYLLLLVLGWNEFMAVLRSPILFTLLLLILLGLYIAYSLQMLGPMMRLSMALIDQTKNLLKEKLKEILVEEPKLAAVSTD